MPRYELPALKTAVTMNRKMMMIRLIMASKAPQIEIQFLTEEGRMKGLDFITGLFYINVSVYKYKENPWLEIYVDGQFIQTLINLADYLVHTSFDQDFGNRCLYWF
jgi:hypothetical protein